MRKIVIFLFIIMLLIICINKNTNILIPENAIRIRIVANSNDLKDQEIKLIIKDKVNELLYSKLKNVNNYNDARSIISSCVKNIENTVEEYTDDYKVIYGKNYFPKKEYKGVSYEEGNYESLVIKLGNAKGNNFWCVLFPPLCMIDENKLNNVSYKFFVSELLNKIK